MLSTFVDLCLSLTFAIKLTSLPVMVHYIIVFLRSSYLFYIYNKQITVTKSAYVYIYIFIYLFIYLWKLYYHTNFKAKLSVAPTSLLLTFRVVILMTENKKLLIGVTSRA
jgi:hypothetical protein